MDKSYELRSRNVNPTSQITCRKGIKENCSNEIPDHHPEELESELTSSENKKLIANYNSTTEGNINESGIESAKRDLSEKSRINFNKKNIIKSSICLIIIAIIYALIFLTKYTILQTEAKTNNDINELKNQFPTQQEDIWISLETGVYEVKNFSKPSVLMYLYDKQSEEFIDKFIRNIAMYASTELNGHEDIIYLTSNDLNTSEANSDYGYVLNKYKNELENKSVMVVKNVDKVPGSVAQAFHSFCDEYTPWVKKSLFIFTIKVEKYTDSVSNYQHVDYILRENWKVLDVDIYEALFTRLSSMINRIYN